MVASNIPNSPQTHTFHVKGMHCHACVLLTESEIGEDPKVRSAKSDLASCTIEVTGDFGGLTPAEIAKELTEKIEKHGYTLSLEREDENIHHWSDFKLALPIAILFLAGFFLLQKLGIVNAITASNVTYGTAFFIGIVASLSTCMAVVGGLLLSLSANYAKSGDKVKPQVMFHIGRLIGFFILGGVIGLIGSAFKITPMMNFVIGLVIAFVMFILGVNLLDVFPWAKRFQFSPPKVLSKNVLGAAKMTHTVAPFLIGIATFFLPCGFTQSMQVYSLSTGSFSQGALTMLAFALGTLPVLALMSFTSLSIQQGIKSRIFFKVAGLIVIVFALFNLINSLVIIGIIPPIFNF
ncbi:MAG: sulfite exporter TauE/SafE family protein [Candidatus Gracilibacteria bacterium]